MTEREERRFAEVSRESVKLMAESSGVELSDDVAALLSEDVCYRLREATQVSRFLLSAGMALKVCLQLHIVCVWDGPWLATGLDTCDCAVIN